MENFKSSSHKKHYSKVTIKHKSISLLIPTSFDKIFNAENMTIFGTETLIRKVDFSSSETSEKIHNLAF